jgi:sec-independent protein translocase protein TatB
MFNLDPGKLLVIGVVAIILLGPDRLPQVARQLGGAWRSFNEFRHRMESEVRNTMPDLPPTSEIARLARSPSALLNHLSNMSSDEEPDGSFQPPTLGDEDATAEGAVTGAAGNANGDGTAAPPAAASAATGSDGARAEPSPPPPPPRPAPSPKPAPTRADDPARANQPSGVVVPGDPTLN